MCVCLWTLDPVTAVVVALSADATTICVILISLGAAFYADAYELTAANNDHICFLKMI